MLIAGVSEIWFIESVENRGGRPPNLKPDTILAWLDVVAQEACENYRRATQPRGMSDAAPTPEPADHPHPTPRECPPKAPGCDMGASDSEPDPDTAETPSEAYSVF